MFENLFFQHPYFILIGLGVYLLWVIDFFYLFQKSQIFFRKKVIKKPSLSLFFLGTLGFLLLSLSLGLPRVRKDLGPKDEKLNDLFFLIDVSLSMMVNDYKPSRLEAAKKVALDFVQLNSKNRFGIILFAEKVFTFLPLTTDQDVVIDSLRKITIMENKLGGKTNIGDALALMVLKVKSSEAKHKTAILITDGVSNEGIPPIEALKIVQEANIKVYTVGVGTKHTVKRAELEVDFELLKKIAQKTGAKSYLAKDEKSLEDIFKEIESLEKKEIKVDSEDYFDEKFYPLALLGVIFIFLTEIIKRFFLKELL